MSGRRSGSGAPTCSVRGRTSAMTASGA